MAEAGMVVDDPEDLPERKRKRRWAKRLGWLLLIIALPFVIAAAFFSSPIGKRWVTEQIAQVAPASGLRFTVGRIEGDIYGQATLHDVVFSDPKGEFLTIPEVELDWRPLSFLWSGIDVRELTARRGRLERLPELLPGDPDAPLLPDFDIRIDKFVIDNMVIAPGVAGPRAHTANLAAKVDIRSGRVLVDADGALGREDRLALLLDAMPDGDRFDLSLDYVAAADGPIAQMAGLDARYEAKVRGDGSWSKWVGHALVTRQDASGARETVAAARLTNIAGKYGLLGEVDPMIDDGSVLARALGDKVALAVTGTLESSVFDGKLTAVTPALHLRGGGGIDLADNRFDAFDAWLKVRDPDVLGETLRLEDTLATAVLDGPFRDLTIDHDIAIGRLVSGTATLDDLRQTGTARYDGVTFTVPLDARVARVETGNAMVDPRLVEGTLQGVLTYAGTRIAADNARLVFPDLSATLALRGDTARGTYALAGPISARGLAFDGIGTVDATARTVARFGSDTPWSVTAQLDGVLRQVSNATVANLAGNRLAFKGGFEMAANRPIALRNFSLAGDRLTARFDSRIVGGTTSVTGRGRHVDYGPFDIDATIDGNGPRATLVLADPYPAAGLRDVRVTLAPEGDGFAIQTSGQSLLGPFDGDLNLVIPASGPTRIAINRLEVYRTNVIGGLTLGEDGIAGNLALEGGGLDGTIGIAPQAGGALGFDLDLTARQARFGGEFPIALARADIDVSGTFQGGSSRIVGSARGSGLEYGSLNIAQFAVDANVVDGRGDVTGSIAGRRSSRFALKFDGDFTPDRIAVLARGEYGGRPITMPRRAVLTARDGGGWSLAPTQIGYAGGYAIFEGALGGEGTRLEAKLSRMPLRLADLTGTDLALGGRLSGLIDWNQPAGALPTARARIRIDDFSRSGLVLSSTPMDVLAVIELTPDRLTFGARMRDDGSQLGRLDGRVTGLGGGSDLMGRIMRGNLNARFAYNGNASSLWRLAAIETFDLTGPINVTANATGTLSRPRITGAMAGDDLRLQSAISGTDIDNVAARGRFAGSRLEISRFAGTTRGGGKISGSGTVDLGGMSAERGPRIDLRAAASNARLLNANGLDATITGPLRIVSDGTGGTIAGRVTIDRASWSLGVAAEDLSLPRIATRDINRLDSTGPTRTAAANSWRYLINASSPGQVAVDGMGLDSEWGVDIALRGTVDNPRIGGQADLVRGDYTFAGTRFELTRGRIRFDQGVPIDPRLDIEAEANAQGTNVIVAITGNAQSPEIAFSSEPPLPEEEILARLLFGGSVTSLSATDALQLGAALASLRGGGGGLDPIGTLRRSIGLDQLRIVSADPALGRQTGIALGKNLGRRFYVEIVTDGRGYSATSVEFRVTRWLALLATVSTIGRDSVVAEVSRDY